MLLRAAATMENNIGAGASTKVIDKTRNCTHRVKHTNTGIRSTKPLRANRCFQGPHWCWVEHSHSNQFHKTTSGQLMLPRAAAAMGTTWVVVAKQNRTKHSIKHHAKNESHWDKQKFKQANKRTVRRGAWATPIAGSTQPLEPVSQNYFGPTDDSEGRSWHGEQNGALWRSRIKQNTQLNNKWNKKRITGDKRQAENFKQTTKNCAVKQTRT